MVGINLPLTGSGNYEQSHKAREIARNGIPRSRDGGEMGVGPDGAAANAGCWPRRVVVGARPSRGCAQGFSYLTE